MFDKSVIIAADKVDLSGAWSSVAALFDGSFWTFITICGGAIAAFGIFSMVYHKMRGRSKISSDLIMIGFGALLATPKALLPLLLAVFDFFANIIVGLLGKVF